MTLKTRTTYHIETQGKGKVTSHEINQRLEKMIGISRKDWASKLDDALWAFKMTFKTLVGTSLYKVSFEKILSFTC